MENNITRISNDIQSDFFITTITGIRKHIGRFHKKTLKFDKNINSVHIFKKANAVGIDAGLLPYLEDNNCQEVILKRTDKLETLRLPFVDFLANGFTYPTAKQTNVKKQFQPSYIVSIEKWNREN